MKFLSTGNTLPALLAGIPSAHAEDSARPLRPVKSIVPFPPGRLAARIRQEIGKYNSAVAKAANIKAG